MVHGNGNFSYSKWFLWKLAFFLAFLPVTLTILIFLVTTDQVSFYTNRLFSSDDANKVATSTTTIILTGDLFLGRDVEQKIAALGLSYPLQHVSDEFSLADYVVVNFESSVPNIHQATPSGSFTFSVPIKNLDLLKQNNITHASLANNHSDDYGVNGYKETRANLEKHTAVFGSAYTVDEEISVAYLDTVTGKVALIGVNLAGAPFLDKDAKTLFSVVNQKSELQLVYVHWGEEYEPVHSDKQRDIAASLVNMGADIIVGHHPHVIQDVDYINGVPVFYSLGNFIFDQYFSTDVQIGLILRLTLESDKGRIELLPTSSIGTKAQSHILEEDEKQKSLQLLSSKSHPSLKQNILHGVLPIAF